MQRRSSRLVPRWYRRWLTVGSMVAHLALVRPVYRSCDALLFAWWWYGMGEDGASRWRWYRALDDRFSSGYLRLYTAMLEVIAREVGQ